MIIVIRIITRHIGSIVRITEQMAISETSSPFQEGGLQIMGFMFILPLYLGYCVLKTHTLSTGDFVATFNGAFSVASSFSFLTIFVARNFSEQAKMIEKYRAANKNFALCYIIKAQKKIGECCFACSVVAYQGNFFLWF